MQKLSDEKIKIVPKNGQDVSGPVAPKKGLTLFGFFTSTKAETRGKNAATVLKESVLKGPHVYIPRANLTSVKHWVALEEKIVHDYKEQKTTSLKIAAPLPKTPAKQSPDLHGPRANPIAVRNWVALEEKIVHDYKAQKPPPFKSTVPFPKIPAKQPLPAFETFSTQTAVASSPKTFKLKEPLRDSERTSPGLGRFLLVLGGLAAGTLVFLYLQGVSSNREALERLAQIQNEKDQLKQSYAALKNASEDQSEEMKWLNSQLHDMAVELKKAKAGKIAYEQNLEKKYREELMRITMRYESELAALRGTVETQNAVVTVLRAQSHAFEKIFDQAGMSALSGAAAGFSQEPFPVSGTSALQGKITSVNGRQGFVVIDGGATQGVRSGCRIAIFRSGIGLATGRIDRVYPTMSVAVLHNASMLQVIQEGDSVSFS